jgi:hypothetical protein
MTITIKKRGYWCLRVVYTLCQGLESDGRNFLAAIVRTQKMLAASDSDDEVVAMYLYYKKEKKSKKILGSRNIPP